MKTLKIFFSVFTLPSPCGDEVFQVFPDEAPVVTDMLPSPCGDEVFPAERILRRGKRNRYRPLAGMRCFKSFP